MIPQPKNWKPRTTAQWQEIIFNLGKKKWELPKSGFRPDKVHHIKVIDTKKNET